MLFLDKIYLTVCYNGYKKSSEYLFRLLYNLTKQDFFYDQKGYIQKKNKSLLYTNIHNHMDSIPEVISICVSEQ